MSAQKLASVKASSTAMRVSGDFAIFGRVGVLFDGQDEPCS